jgi:hypothetical protein
MRQAPYIAATLPQLVRHIEDSGLRTLTWRDTTNIVLDYFRSMRDLVLADSERSHSDGKTGIPILDGYFETFAELNGRSGILVARRLEP